MTHYYPSQVISCDQNLNRCCELIELTAKIQGQLFSILNLTAAEGKLYICSAGLGFHLQSLNQAVITHGLFTTRSGGHYAGVDTLKMRLLPWLGTCFSMARPSVTDDTSLQLIQVTTFVTMLKNTECFINKSIKIDSIESNITP